MGILDAVLGGQNTQLITQLARSSGIDESAVQSVISQLLPAVSQGIKNNAVSADGLGGLMNAISQGNHQRYPKFPHRVSPVIFLDKIHVIFAS